MNLQANRWELFWGGVLVLAGILFLLANFGILAFSIGDLFRYGWPLILIVVGILVMFGRNAAGGENSSADKVIRLDEQEIRDLKLSYSLDDVDVHLTRANFPEGTAKAKISVGVGDLDVWVPRGIPISIRVSAGLGEVKLFENNRDGFAPRLEFTSPDYAQATRRLDLECDVGLGDVDVQYGMG